MGYVRWVICALLFFAATINYIDRQVIGLLKPTLQTEFGWTEIDYGDIVFSFQLAYAIGLLFAGRLIDRLGTRIGFAIAIVVWSLAAIGPRRGAGGRAVRGRRARLVRPRLLDSASPASCCMRFLLGLGEAGNFPAAIKTVAEWFPKRERALRDRHLQLRHQHRRARHAAGRAVDHRHLRLVLGVHRDRR